MTRSNGMPTPRPTPRPTFKAVLVGDGVGEVSTGVGVLEAIREVIGVTVDEVAMVLVGVAAVLDDGTAFVACVRLK